MPDMSDTSRWQRIDWSPPLPADFIFPEGYFRFEHDDLLDRPQRVALNHLAVCYSCEQAIHFERLLIGYMERHRPRLTAVPAPAIQRMIDEEHVHIGAFYQVLEKVRPDLYARRTLRWLRWGVVDTLLTRLTPLATFFTMTLLLEEVTLFIPVAMDEAPAESFPPVHEVMRLHAREERGHVGIDARILEVERAARARWWMALQVLLCLPLLLYVDLCVKAAWRRVVDRFVAEQGLDARARKRLLRKLPPRSDVMGIQSFVSRMRGSSLPGARMLCGVLARQV